MTAQQRRTTAAARLVPGALAEGTAAFPYSLPTHGPEGELRYENIVYSCEPGYRPLFLDLRVPQHGERPPLIIWIHGGGWIYGSRRRLPPHLFENAVHDQMIEAGYAVASVDYRLAREAGFAGMLLDVKAAIRWLRGHAAEFDIDPERVILWGESAGGHIAVMAGLCTKLDDVERTGEQLEQPETPTVIVDWYGPADLTDMSELDLAADTEESGSTAEHPATILQQHGQWTYAELSTITYVRPGVPPMFIAHGAEDHIVPVDQSRELVARLRSVAATVDYLEVPGADHVWRGAASVPDIVARSLSFVAETLLPIGGPQDIRAERVPVQE
jgi:acetyl esterase/lipase